MKIEKILKELKKDYLLISPKASFTKDSWEVVRKELDQREYPALLKYAFVRYALLAIFLVLIVGGVAEASSKALPGEPLYPVKILSEHVVSKLSHGSLIKVEHRAREITDTIREKKENQEDLKQAVDSYTNAVLETKEETKKNQKDKKFDQILKKQEEQFKEIKKDNPSSRDSIEGAIKAAREGQDTAQRVEQKIDQEVKDKKKDSPPSLFRD